MIAKLIGIIRDLIGGEEQKPATPAPVAKPATAPAPQKPVAPKESDSDVAVAEDDYDANDDIDEVDSGEVTLDPLTLHGTHYTVEAFDAEVEKRVQAWIASEKADGCDVGKSDIDNFYFNYRREVYCEWTGADMDQMIRWEQTNSKKHTGIATMGYAQADTGNPLLEPIHGISLEDYAAMALKLSSGSDLNAVCQAMGIESAVWEEVNTLWGKRMQEDASFQVVTLYGQYFATAGNHPKLANLSGAPVSAAGQANLEKIKTDRYFYEELCGARQAAYEYGLDGAQWILDNFGITLGDFQSVASQYSIEQNKNWSAEQILHFHDYQETKQKEYAAKFAAEQGGNIADDVNF